MNAERKLRFSDLLVKIGIKEIGIGIPSASATEFDPSGPRSPATGSPTT
jgi:2-isopropylmalate synthase